MLAGKLKCVQPDAVFAAEAATSSTSESLLIRVPLRFQVDASGTADLFFKRRIAACLKGCCGQPIALGSGGRQNQYVRVHHDSDDLNAWYRPGPLAS